MFRLKFENGPLKSFEIIPNIRGCVPCLRLQMYTCEGLLARASVILKGLPSCYTLLSLSLAGWKACGIIEDDDLVAHGAGKFEQEFTISLRELQDSWEFCS